MWVIDWQAYLFKNFPRINSKVNLHLYREIWHSFSIEIETYRLISIKEITDFCPVVEIAMIVNSIQGIDSKKGRGIF
jgi:hypothetical protein